MTESPPPPPRRTSPALRALQRWLRRLFIVPAILIILLESLLLRRLGGLLRRLTDWPFLRGTEAWLARRAPWQTAILFLVPLGIVQLLKLLPILIAYWGHKAFAAALFIFIEIVGDAFLGWIFLLCQPSLMKMAWFARAVGLIAKLRGVFYDTVRASAAWRVAHAALHRARTMTHHARGYYASLRRWQRGRRAVL